VTSEQNYERRIRRLVLALVRERRHLEESERALDVNSREVRRLREEKREALAHAWSAYLDIATEARLEDGTPLLTVVFETHPELRKRLETALRGTT